MGLNNYQKLSYKWFRNFTEVHVSDKLKEDLQSAHIPIRAGAYLAYTLLSSILAFIISFAAISVFVFGLLPFTGVAVNTLLTVIFLLIPLIIFGLTFLIMYSLPASRAKARGKKINMHLAYAINFISAMSSAGVTPTEIFRSLSKQETYSEIKNEAAWIYRDVTLLGMDILTAIRNNIIRTPSQKFKEFLQGLVVTVTSGGSLKSYFMTRANQYMIENRREQKKTLESLGIMAESYVTAAVAGILLLLIVIPLMMIIKGDFQEPFLYILILFVIPLIHFGFSVVVRTDSMKA